MTGLNEPHSDGIMRLINGYVTVRPKTGYSFTESQGINFPMGGIGLGIPQPEVETFQLPTDDLIIDMTADPDGVGYVALTSQDGIRLSLKTKAGHLTEDPHTAAELCQAVRGLGLTLDPSYYVSGASQGQSYDQVFPHVFHTHLRDTTPDQIQVQIGLGEIDYSRLISQLRRANYNRALSVDILPTAANADDRPLEMRKLRMLLDTLL